MAHVRGHIVKLARDKSSTDENYTLRTGTFFRYLFAVTGYNGEGDRIKETDSYESRFGDVLLFLSADHSLDQVGAFNEINVVLKPQSEYIGYTRDWSLNGTSNWLVYDRYDQNHSHDVESDHHHE